MRLILFFIGLFLSFSSFGQIFKPVKWTFELKPGAKDEYTLIAKAIIDEGWWVYSQHLGGEDGPIPTSIAFDEGTHYKLVGKNKESDNAKTVHDQLFDMEVTKFSHYFTIEQKIKILDSSKPISGYLEFMTCNDERCLPPDEVLFSLKPAKGSSGDAAQKPDNKTTTADATEKDPGTAEKKKISEDKLSGTSTSVIVNTESDPKSTTGILDPVKWSFRSEKKSEGHYEVIAEAVIDKGWHIYGGGNVIDKAPAPTILTIEPNDGYILEGVVLESGSQRVEGHDPYFDMKLVTFKQDAKFTQLVKTDNKSILTGNLEYTTCDESKCLPPQVVEFKIDLTSGMPIVDNTLQPLTVDRDGVIDQTISSLQSTYADPLSDCGEVQAEASSNLFWMFILGFGGGLLALLTPCVFPMIPLTVSFFTKDTKRKGWKNGLLYGASIIIIYVAFGILLTLVFGASALNDLSTNAIANTIFFVIFIFFALSFFGYYEITLPSSWSNKSDSLADKGGLIGIFFMAATLSIVSFSCTGPLIGSALVEASSEGTLGPAVVMFGFSLALAIPFGLFAIFPAWLNSLPKSGGWMNSVKVVLGFVELALAFKFLSVADMASHWGFLRYELFMGIWVLITFAIAAYLFGFIRFPHDNPRRKIMPIPAFLGIFFLALALYLSTGFFRSEKTGTYNALSIMSGLAPPAHYNYFVPVKELNADLKSQYGSLTKCANNFDCFHDYYEGLAYAKQQNKPILLDFTGYGCVNCRKTEEHIWVDDDVRRKINEDFVLVSLYVDDKEALDTIIYSAIQNKRIKTVGDVWADFQIVNFKQNSQPLYVLLSPDQQILTTPKGYDPDIDAYNNFLDCGLNAFKELNTPVIGSAN
ncbi:MAG: thioredoxin family protein [Bacteroidota bacterium]|nr:thioredoxin family protein [Bacteroidota bacterium]